MESTEIKNYAFANPDFIKFTGLQKIAITLGFSGLIVLFIGVFGVEFSAKTGFLTYGLLSILGGTIIYSYDLYGKKGAGIKNDHVWQNVFTNRGLYGWLFGIILTTFYVVLYFYPTVLGLGKDGAANTGIVGLFDPLSKALSGKPASQWFVYGALYTLLIFAFGIKFMWKYRHNRYHQLRTVSIIFFQTAFAFLIPEFMARLNGDIPYYDLKNMWPLNYYNFDQYRVDYFVSGAGIGWFMLGLGVLSIFVISPILTYFYGKRWYCSWVCGCGGLAETTGDSFRQLSDKTVYAWKVERWLIYSVLVFAVLMTVALISTYLGYNNEDGTPKYLISKETFLIGTMVFITGIFTWTCLRVYSSCNFTSNIVALRLARTTY